MENISRHIKRQMVEDKAVRLVMGRLNRRMLAEADDSADMRTNVMKMLKDNKYNHAQLAYAIWNPKDQSERDTYRSLFSKMVTGTPDADGNVRQFSDEDVTKLYQLLRKH